MKRDSGIKSLVKQKPRRSKKINHKKSSNMRSEVSTSSGKNEMGSGRFMYILTTRSRHFRSYIRRFFTLFLFLLRGVCLPNIKGSVGLILTI